MTLQRFIKGNKVVECNVMKTENEKQVKVNPEAVENAELRR